MSENHATSAKRLLPLDPTIYGLEAIKKAAYKFADRASILIIREGANVVVAFDFAGPKFDKDTKRMDEVVADFSNELLDQDLREIVKKETSALRSVIIAHAFSQTTLAEGS